MPIEIRELVIKATVVQNELPRGSAAAAATNNGVSPNEERLQEALEKIVESLKKKNER